MKKIGLLGFLMMSFFTSFATINWMGNHSTGSQPTNSQTIHFYVEMFDSYSGCHAEVSINEGGNWVNYLMTQGPNNGNNSTWTVDINVKSNSSAYFFHGWDDWGANVYDSNSGSNYAISINPTTKSGGNGNWSDGGNWCDGSVPSSTSSNYIIAHTLTLNQAATVGSLTINSGITFTASDNTHRILTITKSTSGSSTTLSNSGTWANGSGGSTVVFTGAPGSGDAIHAISGTFAFHNITVNKTGGSSNVGVSFGANSSVSGTLEIGTGGFVSTAPPASFYGTSAILKFNQGEGAIYSVNSGDYSWSSTVVPNYITISSGTVNLNADRTASGNLLIDGGILVLNNNTPNLTIQGNWTRTAGAFTSGTGTVTLSGTTNTIISTSTDATLYDLVVSKTGGAYVSLSSNLTVGHNMTISSGIFNIPSGKSLTVSGTLTNSAGNAGLVVKSGGSLITSSAVSATVEREIEARIPSYQGWHFISSPVAAQAFQPNFVSNPPSANEDFYLWSETTNEWLNSKSGTSPNFTFNSAAFGSNFIVGQGYLAAYSALSTKSFLGTLNVADVPKTLNYTGTSGRKGWNLLGNPFTSGIKWNVTTWGVSNVAGIAKIIKSSDGSYQDISADGYIPALNGFLVRTTVNNQSITIPAAAKEHIGTWYKSDEIKQFALTVRDIEGATAQTSNIRVNPEATTDFDFLYDGEFVALYAPQFYSIAGENKLSTNSLPEITNETVINFGFVKNEGNQFRIEAEDLEDFGAIAYLTDLKTGTVQNLNSNPVYSFTSAAGDQPNRFKLSFESVGIDDVKEVSPGIYTYGNKLCVENSGQATLEVYNMAGQRILVQDINNAGLYQTTLNNQTGYYVVRLTNAGQVKVSKVFIK